MTLPARSIVVLGLFALALAVQPTPVHAQHGHDDAVARIAPPAQRWVADADLRDGVGRIHAALERLRGAEAGHMPRAAALAETAKIEQAAADIFAKCKLAPEQDTALHGMLAPLLAAAGRFKADPNDTTQVAAMRAAMADYPLYFDAPAWLPDPARVH